MNPPRLRPRLRHPVHGDRAFFTGYVEWPATLVAAAFGAGFGGMA